jgi:hypothetical protein
MMMKRVNLFVLAMAALFLAGSLVPAQSVEANRSKGNSNGKDFLGLWEGIDPNDGSSVTVSLTTDQENDGFYRILWQESSWSYCDGSPNGLIDVSGPIEGSSIVATGQLICFDTDETICFGDDDDCLEPFSLDTGPDGTLRDSGSGTTISVHKISSQKEAAMTRRWLIVCREPRFET